RVPVARRPGAHARRRRHGRRRGATGKGRARARAPAAPRRRGRDGLRTQAPAARPPPQPRRGRRGSHGAAGLVAHRARRRLLRPAAPHPGDPRAHRPLAARAALRTRVRNLQDSRRSAPHHGDMRKLIPLLVATAVAVPSFAAVSWQDPRWHMEAKESKVEPYLGRDSLFLRDGNAWLDGANLRDGVIEVDIAAPGDVGFHGVAFRAADHENYELFYLRSHLSKQPDATQYTPVYH